MTEFVATFLGAANILEGTIRDARFVTGDVRLEIDGDRKFKEGEKVKMVFRPEDVFLRRPENLTQNYQKLTDGTIKEVTFVGAFERLTVRVDLRGREEIFVNRPKTETAGFPMHNGQTVPWASSGFASSAIRSPSDGCTPYSLRTKLGRSFTYAPVFLRATDRVLRGTP